MAQSISDVFARGDRLGDTSRRTARFLEPASPAELSAKTVDLSQSKEGDDKDRRRAAFRPAETVALRRDVVEAFAAAMMRDGAVDGPGGWQALFYAALAAEALGDYELAFQRLRQFEEEADQVDWTAGQARRRVLRAMEADELLSRALNEAAGLAGAPEWAALYAGLERAYLGWLKGDDPSRVLRRCERALRGVVNGAAPDAFAALWATQLSCDAALEAGDVEAALESLEIATARPEIVVETRHALEARRAVWLHVYGRYEEARALLEELSTRGSLPGDLDDLLLSLSFEVGDLDRAFSLLRSHARDKSRLKTHALPLVMLHDREEESAAVGRDLLREATEEQDDWTLLRLREQLLDAAIGEQGSGAGAELIDVLNRRLEGPLSTDERVSTLVRLGRFYELEASLEEAAAEVYREALSYDPQHIPALRALGRLYTRRENWQGLAELYEREIASPDAGRAGWRRHFQLAEIYEHHLQMDERALENYLIVLDERPNYLPALKSSARILERLGRWTRLADLFLRMVDSAPSRRQKLYLLDKVAEVAEVRLQNFDVAIGAWKEILELEAENPRAFTALGRLYAKTKRWDDLIALNEVETELIADPEEIAAVLLRNAEIAERNLDDIERAERYYRRALNVIPDYLPALEALGRIYLRGGRWAEIVKMTGRELQALKEPEKAALQLDALAEIFETHLDRRQDAINIYEELYALEPTNGHIFYALCRLYRAEQDWQALERILWQRLELAGNQKEFAALQGELAILAEWRTDSRERAYGHYLAALQSDPTNLHWLGGVARTWPAAGVDALEVASQLEALLMHTTSPEVRDRYFMIIARHRERAQRGPEASRAYRAHGAPDSLENQIVLRLAMATAGERLPLVEARRAQPHHPAQRMLVLDRTTVDEWATEDLAAERGTLTVQARQWLAGELPPLLASALQEPATLGVDLAMALEGMELYLEAEEGDIGPEQMRLRALQARRSGDHGNYQRWTEREIEVSDSQHQAARLLELARYAHKFALAGQDELVRRACYAFFPELNDEDEEGAATEVISERLIDDLFKGLRETERYLWLRRCLEAQVARPEVERVRRLELFAELATLLKDELDDFEGARDALVHCWQLSEEPHFLREIVILAENKEEWEEAQRFQRLHLERLCMSARASVEERLESGIWLARLLMEHGGAEALDEAMERLEVLTEDEERELESWSVARRLLGRAYARAGMARQAAATLEDVLHIQVRRLEKDDWRLLVELYRQELDDPFGAYQRQWAIVQAFPDSQVDLDLLIDIAAEADELSDCIEQLSTLATATTDGRSKAALIARAAEAADEELGHAEEACRLFEKVLSLIDEDDERRDYYKRRRAVCLARMAGREAKALEAFRELIASDPFEPATYRGLEALFDRVQALDRLRVARQTLRALGCEAEEAAALGKVHATRTLPEDILEETLLPKDLQKGVMATLRELMPLAEKVWADGLPQRKAFDGRRIRSGAETPFYDDLQAALLAFGIAKFRLHIGESGPEQPMVFCEATPSVWLNEQLLEGLTAAESRFIAGYCAALLWSDAAALTALDGRQVWHLLEGVVYRQTGAGFSERIDINSQRLAEVISGPFDAKARRRVVQALEECEVSFMDAHCEAWGRQLELFAARAGFLLSGDLEAALSAHLRLGGWKLPLAEKATQRRLQNDGTARDLIGIAHSEEFLELRYRLGLAGRPSKLKI